MYSKVGGAVLPATGLFLPFWWVIAAVALIGVGAIILRMIPKKES